jgi:RHS repeat-associated protein
MPRLLYALFLAFLFILGTSSASAAINVTYFHNDISGSPMIATDAAGNVVWKEGYRPYGEKTRNEVPSRDGKNKIGYAGSPFDANTGLSYMGARYYDPVIGRFMGVDPVGFQEANIHSFNRYAYGNNNPYKFVDPNGRIAIPAILAAIEAIAVRASVWVAQRQVGAIMAAEIGAGIATGAVVPSMAIGAAGGKAINAAKGFADEAKLIGHFERHGAEFGAKSATEYLQVGRDIMQNGQKLEYLYKGEARTGYVQFMGNKANGTAKFGFVGTNTDDAITTIHTESGNSFWKMLNGSTDKTINSVP